MRSSLIHKGQDCVVACCWQILSQALLVVGISDFTLENSFVRAPYEIAGQTIVAHQSFPLMLWCFAHEQPPVDM